MKIDYYKNQNDFIFNSLDITNLKQRPPHQIININDTYFQFANNFSNINKELIYKTNNISFKGTVNNFTKSLITNEDIPRGCSAVNCHDANLSGSLKLKRLRATEKESLLEIDDSAKGNIELNEKVSIDHMDAYSLTVHDNVIVGNANCTNSIIMTDYSKIANAKSNYIAMFDSTDIEKAYSTNIELRNDSKIGKIYSKGDLTIYGEGSVGDIECEGHKIFITGPIKVEGKIKFDTNGEVFVLNDENNKSATILNGVKNGIIRYQVQADGNDRVLINRNLFSDSVDAILSELSRSDKRKLSNKYKIIESFRPSFASLDKKEVVIAGHLYDEFAQDTLLSLAESSADKEFSAYWVKNKKIGKKNLADFWLRSLNIDSTGKSNAEKAAILNKLSSKQKQKLIGLTVDYWVKNILPIQLAKISKNDIDYLKLDETCADIIENLKNGRKDALMQLINEEGIEQFESASVDDKTLLALWIDTIDGEGSAEGYSLRQKKNRLMDIISSGDNLDKICKATTEKADEISEQIDRTQKAYSNLLEDCELNKSQKEILRKYQNNRLFFYIVNVKAKDKKSITSLEISTQSIVENLENEKNKAIQEARKRIFEPMKDFNYISANTNAFDTEGKIQIIMSILKDKINTSPPKEAEQTKKALKLFRTALDHTPEATESNWIKIVNEAQQHFENVQIDKVLDINIQQIYTTQKTLKEDLPPEISKALQDKTLNNAQKDFIARHKDDNNLINLLKQPAIKRSDDIDSLIGTEQVNNSVFEAISTQFRQNISPETIKLMSEIADTYINLLGVDASKLNHRQKFEFLSTIPDEELELVSNDVKRYWVENFLSKAISGNILDKVRDYDAGYRAAQMDEKLGNITIQLDNQQHTLLEISGNIDDFIDIYKETSAETNSKLSQMAKTMEDIHLDTSNIRTNVKAMLFHSIQSTKDPILKGEMGELLQDADRMELSEFLRTIDEKQEQYKRDHRKQEIFKFVKKALGPLVIAGTAVAIDAIAPGAGTFLTTHGLPALGSVFTNNLGHAINTAVQCSGPKVGFFASILSKNKLGDMAYTT